MSEFLAEIGPKKELHCRQNTRKTSTIAIYLSLHWPYWEKPRGQLPGKLLRGAFAMYKAANKMTKKRENKRAKQEYPFAHTHNSLSE